MIALKSLRFHLTYLLQPAIRLISRLGKPEPLCDENDYKKIKMRSRPGDILLSKENFRLSNILISGFWSHAAIILDDLKVLEAVPNKVRKINLDRFVYQKDHVALLRPKFFFKFQDYSKEYVNDKYDFEFLSGNDSWYCSEIVFDYLRKIAPKMPFNLRKTWGIETSTPDDFYNAKDKFEVIYENRNKGE